MPNLVENYHVGLRPMLATLNQQVAPCDLVWMTNTDATYIYYLFFSLYPPQRFPGKFAALEQGGMLRLAQIEQIRRLEHSADFVGFITV